MSFIYTYSPPDAIVAPLNNYINTTYILIFLYKLLLCLLLLLSSLPLKLNPQPFCSLTYQRCEETTPSNQKKNVFFFCLATDKRLARWLNNQNKQKSICQSEKIHCHLFLHSNQALVGNLTRAANPEQNQDCRLFFYQVTVKVLVRLFPDRPSSFCQKVLQRTPPSDMSFFDWLHKLSLYTCYVFFSVGLEQYYLYLDLSTVLCTRYPSQIPGINWWFLAAPKCQPTITNPLSSNQLWSVHRDSTCG